MTQYKIPAAEKKFIFSHVVNHVSGKNFLDEFEKSLYIGGRLPFRVLLDQLEHMPPRERRKYYAANKRIFG